SWLRDYLYIPLGGSRHGIARTVVNLLTVMVLGGLWHGAAWTFVVWGAWHGAWLVAERLIRVRATASETVGTSDTSASSARTTASRNAAPGAPTIRRVYTLIVVMIGWVFFRAENFDAALVMVRSMVGFGGVALPATLRWQIEIGSLAGLIAGIWFVVVEPRVFAHGNRRPILLAILFCLCVARLLVASYSPFLYFQF
ncbi:MAG: membrane-bound O-acyltransferase family protein, partial [Spirochaetales bacterium]|nr:membrane-bound O-acyltransferase family protein [Spirochaetales bacterium]